jgi:glucosyl-dolichyl phosphate glucuronosyltransferase
MSGRSARDVTVLICTFNRAALLRETLASLAAMVVPFDWDWDVLVVDNHSTDDTRRVVGELAPAFPVPLRYAHESRPGKSSAFNRGLASGTGRVVASVDDDVLVCAEWLSAACSPLLGAGTTFDYTGGPVAPLWEAPPPPWFPDRPSDLWGTVAIVDYGPDAFVFEERQRVPLGANVAFRRDFFARVGGFLPSLGRSQGRILLGQELPELLRRARSAGARGLYVPAMRVHHHVPASRLTRAYFRRWWFGKGVCRARVDASHPITEMGVDLRHVPHVFGVPRFMYRDALRHARRWLSAWIAGDARKRAAHEMSLAYFVGYVSDRRRGAARRVRRGEPAPSLP